MLTDTNSAILPLQVCPNLFFFPPAKHPFFAYYLEPLHYTIEAAQLVVGHSACRAREPPAFMR